MVFLDTEPHHPFQHISREELLSNLEHNPYKGCTSNGTTEPVSWTVRFQNVSQYEMTTLLSVQQKLPVGTEYMTMRGRWIPTRDGWQLQELRILSDTR